MDSYVNLNTDFDTDSAKLDWLSHTIDNGMLLIENLILNYYRNYSSSSIDDLVSQVNLLKEEYQLLKDNHPGDIVNEENSKSIRKCNNKQLSKPKIIKYPNVERLTQDNNKVITDSDGSIIMPGDYALIKDKELQLYIRESLTNGDIWVREDIDTLQRLIKESKEICHNGEEFANIEDRECLFDENNFVCNPLDLVHVDDNIKNAKDKIDELNNEIEFVKQLPSLIRNCENNINKYKK